jgi:hypothetical protein
MARDVFTIIDDLTSGLADLRAVLEPLASLGGDGRAPRTTGRRRRRTAKRSSVSSGRLAVRPRRPASPALRATRKLQGQYLAAVRPLTKAQRLQVKRVLAKDGKQAAIKAAKGMQKAA